MTESTEEAIVSKMAHVDQEVGLNKEVTERVETVRYILTEGRGRDRAHPRWNDDDNGDHDFDSTTPPTPRVPRFDAAASDCPGPIDDLGFSFGEHHVRKALRRPPLRPPVLETMTTTMGRAPTCTGVSPGPPFSVASYSW